MKLTKKGIYHFNNVDEFNNFTDYHSDIANDYVFETIKKAIRKNKSIFILFEIEDEYNDETLIVKLQTKNTEKALIKCLEKYLSSEDYNKCFEVDNLIKIVKNL